ncbi:hypothetical protein LINPERHAP2_LOCUS8302 [Linum perenne]
MFGGPWMVGDHYVVIQDWRPYFQPEESPITTLRVWVRSPVCLLSILMQPS